MPDYFNYMLANIACIVFLGIVVFTLERGGDRQISRVLLTRITRLLILYFASDAVWILFECGVFHSNRVIMYIMTIIPYICLLTTAWLWYVYCETVQGNKELLTPKRTFISAIPFYIALIMLIIGIFADYLFIIDETGYLEYGFMYILLLAIPFGYMLYSSIKAFYRAYTSNRYYDHRLYIAMGIFPLTPLICGVIQASLLTVPIMCYGATAAVLMLYITSTENRISTDSLTGINNRQEMERYLTRKMRSQTQGMDLYLLILDVDRFKSINDKYGHIEGDRALVTMAEALKESCNDIRNRAFLSRFGGDEFIVIVEVESEEQVQNIADSIRSNVVRMNEESGAAFRLEASVGYARFDYGAPVTIPGLIAQADEKLYEMKKANRSGR